MFMLVTHRTYDPSHEDELIRWLDSQFVPALQDQTGFAGYHIGFDRERRRACSIIRWETREQAHRMRDTFADLLRDLDQLGTTLELSEFFEESRYIMGMT